MAQELIVTGTTSQDWDGRYIMQYNTMNSNCDIWKHETKEYFIFRNSWYWMLSSGGCYMEDSYLKATKLYASGSTPTGHYDGINGNPDNDVAWENFP